MNHFSELIPDFGLTEPELFTKYKEHGDSEHPYFPKFEWRNQVFEGLLLGYWAWIVDEIRKVEDELDRDNPYNLEAP